MVQLNLSDPTRIESGLDDPDNSSHLGLFYDGSSGSYLQTEFNILSMLGHSMLSMLLVKLNLEDKLGNSEHHRVVSFLVRDPGYD